MFDLDVMLNSTKITTESAVINYDTSELTYFLSESDDVISSTIAAYNSTLIQAMTESAGDITSAPVQAVLESANESIGQRLLNTLESVKNWLMKKLKEIGAALQNFYNNNLNIKNKIEKSVKERLAKGDYKDLTMEMYDYKLDSVALNNISEVTKGLLSGGSESLESLKEVKSSEVKLSTIKKVYKGSDSSSLTLDNYKEVIHKGLRSGGTKKPRKFSEMYLQELTKDNTAKAVKTVFEELMKKVDEVKNELKSELSKVKDTKTESPEEKKEKSSKIGVFNEKIRILNAAIDAIVSVNSIKLQAANEKVNMAKQFVLKAYTHKTGKKAGDNKKEEPVKGLKEADCYVPWASPLIETVVDELDLGDGIETDEDGEIVW